MAYINPSYIAENSCWLTLPSIFEYQLSSDEQRYCRMLSGQEDMETGQPAVQDRVYSMANAINVQTKVETQEAP